MTVECGVLGMEFTVVMCGSGFNCISDTRWLIM